MVENRIISAVIFPSEGIALAFALFFGKKVWPGIFIAQFMLSYGGNIDVVPSLLIALINSLEAIMAVTIFHWFHLNKNLKSLRDIYGLFLLIVLVLQPFSTILANGVLRYYGYVSHAELFSSTFSWWFGNVMGQFLYTPFLLMLFYYYKSLNLKEYLLKGILFALYNYLLLFAFKISSPLLFLLLTLPFLVYTVYKENIAYALFMNIVTSEVLLLNVGPFVSSSGEVNSIDYNLYILTITLVIFTAGIIFENQKKQEIRLHQTIDDEIEKNKQQQIFLVQQSRLAQMGEMIAMIAHQWRQPLNSLSLINQTIVLRYKRGELDDEVMGSFEQKSKSLIAHMSTTIDDFRNFFRANKEKKCFSVNESIQNVLRLVDGVISSENISIGYKSEHSYFTYGYANEFEQILLNLINNAKDALVEHEIEEKSIGILVTGDETAIVVCIEDNAGGVPEEIMDKIFDPYFSTKNEKNGTGLGLYMVKMILVDHMDADISVSNTKDGALFQITLPRCES
ncbi:PUTATIVE TWO-COMPONENT SENSOR [hydrothermal vent metagenome]|uniref:PUTATIVE TWO-COMPONENT SENSOR n=1 Tax=hydrothermal vent metagenome TaxID=652676 RepID=A0A1W1C2C5_9ZZZZ